MQSANRRPARSGAATKHQDQDPTEPLRRRFHAALWWGAAGWLLSAVLSYALWVRLSHAGQVPPPSANVVNADTSDTASSSTASDDEQEEPLLDRDPSEEVERTPAETHQAPEPPPTPPTRARSEPTGTEPPPAVSERPSASAPVARRPVGEPLPFQESSTELIEAPSSGSSPRGFDMDGSGDPASPSPKSPAEILISLRPLTVQPGGPYILQYRILNGGDRRIGIKSMELVETYAGRTVGRGLTLTPRVSQLPPQAVSVLHEVRGTWSEAQQSGKIEVTVLLVGGSKLRKTFWW